MMSAMDRVAPRRMQLPLAPLLGMFLVAGCALARSDAQDALPGDPHHRLSYSSVERLFRIAPQVHEEGGVAHVYLRCTVSEGPACEFATPAAAAAAGATDDGARDDPDVRASDGPLDRETARSVVTELGIQHVERARDATVLLDCRREQDAVAGCVIHGGGRYWYPVTLTGRP